MHKRYWKKRKRKRNISERKKENKDGARLQKEYSDAPDHSMMLYDLPKKEGYACFLIYMPLKTGKVLPLNTEWWNGWKIWRVTIFLL